MNIPFCFFPSASLLIRNVVIATNDRMTLLSGKTPEENPAPSSFSVFSSVNSMIGYFFFFLIDKQSNILEKAKKAACIQGVY